MASIEQIDQLLERKLQNHVDPLTERMNEISETLRDIKEETNKNGKEVQKVKCDIEKLQKNYEFLNRELIKKKLIIFGLHENENENLQIMLTKFFKEKLNQDDFNIWEIADAKRMGKRDSTSRGIKIELTSKFRKMKILENSKLLKGTNVKIQPEYTKQVMDERKILQPFLKDAKKKGQKAYLVYNKLIIGEHIYTANEIKEKSKEQTNPSDQSEDSEKEETSQVNTPGTSTDQIITNVSAIAPKNSYGAIPKDKRKEISPISTNEGDDLLKKVQEVRASGANLKKYRQQSIKPLFREDGYRNYRN